jgi:hypothetical protein
MLASAGAGLGLVLCTSGTDEGGTGAGEQQKEAEDTVVKVQLCDEKLWVCMDDLIRAATGGAMATTGSGRSMPQEVSSFSGHHLRLRVWVEIMGSGKYENVGESQSIPIMSGPVVSLRTRTAPWLWVLPVDAARTPPQYHRLLTAVARRCDRCQLRQRCRQIRFRASESCGTALGLPAGLVQHCLECLPWKHRQRFRAGGLEAELWSLLHMELQAVQRLHLLSPEVLPLPPRTELLRYEHHGGGGGGGGSAWAFWTGMLIA